MAYDLVLVDRATVAIDPAEDRRCSRCKLVNDRTGVVDITISKHDHDYISLCASCLIECLNQLKDAM